MPELIVRGHRANSHVVVERHHRNVLEILGAEAPHYSAPPPESSSGLPRRAAPATRAGVSARTRSRLTSTLRTFTPDEQAQSLEVLVVTSDSQSRTASIHLRGPGTRRLPDGRYRAGAVSARRGNLSVPLTLFGALRDALVALSPGRSSSLGQLLRTVASEEHKSEPEKIRASSNGGLQADS